MCMGRITGGAPSIADATPSNECETDDDHDPRDRQQLSQCRLVEYGDESACHNAKSAYARTIIRTALSASMTMAASVLRPSTINVVNTQGEVDNTRSANGLGQGGGPVVRCKSNVGAF